MGGGKVGLLYTAEHVFPILSKAWWFLTEYMTILVLSPIINRGIGQLSKAEFSCILLFMLVLNGIGLYIPRENTGSNLLGLLTIYLLGRYLSLFGYRLARGKAALLFLVATLLLFGAEAWMLRLGKGMYCWDLLFYCNPLILLQAVGLFFLFLGMKPRHSSPINWLGSHCFAIYLITEKTGNYYYRWWAELSQANLLLALCAILLVCLVCVVVDVGQAYLNRRIVGYIAARWERISAARAASRR